MFGRAIWKFSADCLSSHPSWHISLPLSLSPQQVFDPVHLTSCSFSKNECGSLGPAEGFLSPLIFLPPSWVTVGQFRERANFMGLSLCRELRLAALAFLNVSLNRLRGIKEKNLSEPDLSCGT